MSNNKDIKENEEMSLKELILKIKYWLQFILLKWKILFIVMLLGSLLGYLYALKQPITYSARITYVLDDGQSAGKNNSNQLALLGLGELSNSNTGGIFSGINLPDLMKSRLLIQKILLKPILFEGKLISLADYYLILTKNYEKNKIYFKPEDNPENFSIDQVNFINSIYSDLVSEKNLLFGSKTLKTNFSSIEVISKNEKFAKLFCEILINETSMFYIETKTKKTKLNIANIQKQVDSIRKTYNASIIDYAKASDYIYNSNPALKSKSIGPLQKNIDVQASTTTLISLIASLESAKSTLQIETPLFQIIDKPILPLTKNEASKSRYSILTGILAVFLTSLFLILSDLFKRHLK
jgi:hypothetical protein